MEIIRRVNWNRAEQIIETEAPVAPAPVQRAVVESPPQTAMAVQVKRRNRQGNGHRSEMVRKLNDGERDWLRAAFLRKNGQIEEDDCVTFKGQMISDVIAIFQITGFISVLHRYVALGRMEVRDLPAYLNWMQSKYGGLWSQWNNTRFVTVRAQNLQARQNGQPAQASIPYEEVPIQGQFSTTPSFKAFAKRGTFHRVGT
jgi:hypothetical protein